MKEITIGILAHVDAGKTTLSEALLYTAGTLKQVGRVDHKNAFLDTHEIERKRGITVFSKQAVLNIGDTKINIIDTPGHFDFSTEMERTLSVLDYAILVVSATSGIQSHTETIALLLQKNNIPTFIFVNKTDISHTSEETLKADLNKLFDGKCVDFKDEKTIYEQSALTLEKLMEEFLSNDKISTDSIAKGISSREIFPLFFGSALKLNGVSELSASLDKYTEMKKYPDEFGARVYKISTDSDKTRLTHLKIMGGSLSVKDKLFADDSEKIHEIRIYSGDKYESVSKVSAGVVCAVSGISKSAVGQGYGYMADMISPVLCSVLSYRAELPIDIDPFVALSKLRILEEEDPTLKINWNSEYKEIHIKLMGAVQIEVLQNIIFERFGFHVNFIRANIVYKETIEGESYGAGHFEPLKHYAEVHLKIKSLKAGSGIRLRSSCSRDVLAENYQNLILWHLSQDDKTGVLINAELTDIEITLVAGRAHNKHTEGGDFKEATYRALRQALMKAKSVLLEPYYNFKIELPTENLGRALNDINMLFGSYEPPEAEGDISFIEGYFPVSTGHDYQSTLLRYTKGRGKISLALRGYLPAHNADTVVLKVGYNPTADPKNTANSVFCKQGSGYTVQWDAADKLMHIPVMKEKTENVSEETKARRYGKNYSVSDDELLAIYERTYGAVKRESFARSAGKIRAEIEDNYKYNPKREVDTTHYLLVDGYNIIFAWEELKEIADTTIDGARNRLCDILCNFAALKNYEIIVVFDAYKVHGGVGSIEQYHNITVVYTKERETADMYIERVTGEMAKKHRVTVATSDRLQQMIIWGHSAYRLSANELLKAVTEAEGEMREILEGLK